MNLAQRLCLVLLASVLLSVAGNTDARIIHRERSLYSTILVDQQGSTLCLQFSVRQDQRNQSCRDRNNPRKLIFPYARMMLASLLLVPNPERILIIGLGGGTLPVTLNELFPEARIDVVEIDSAVQIVAETYFGFSETENMKVILQDARVFTKRAKLRGELYDLVMLDAFNGDYIPEHLMTAEYLQETQALLAPGGVVASNTFAISRLYDHESTTYQEVFGEFYNLRSRSSSNRIIFARREPLPAPDSLLATARSFNAALRPYQVNLSQYVNALSTKVDWDQEARILTDQYSPANLLRDQ